MAFSNNTTRMCSAHHESKATAKAPGVKSRFPGTASEKSKCLPWIISVGQICNNSQGILLAMAIFYFASSGIAAVRGLCERGRTALDTAVLPG